MNIVAKKTNRKAKRQTIRKKTKISKIKISKPKISKTKRRTFRKDKKKKKFTIKKSHKKSHRVSRGGDRKRGTKKKKNKDKEIEKEERLEFFRKVYYQKQNEQLEKLKEIEAESINSVSFVPTDDEINYLYQASTDALKDLVKKNRGPKLSKLHFVRASAGLLPNSLNPDDTILSQGGRGEIVYIKPTKISDEISVIKDRAMPLGGLSNGPNGVLTDCQNKSGKYGINRINLFQKDKETTKKLLDDYLRLRDENINAIFGLFVKSLEESRNGKYMRNDPTNSQLEKKLHDHYDNVTNMMSLINDKLQEKTLDDMGIGVVSYCQTWLSRGVDKKTGETYEKNGNAHFSVMSPHFQTRFYVKDLQKLRESIKVEFNHIPSYIILIQHFTSIMQEDYKGSFIHLDGLQEHYNQKL
tara:strand:- start:1093 stop:2328 length:1236 start_codon:yes stop_codon:yes gene_type:complete